MNSGYLPAATIARLQNSDSVAVAATNGPRLLRDIEAGLHTTFQPVADWAEVFRLVQHHAPGTHAVLLIRPRGGVGGHVVAMTNFNGEPVIIEGQGWGPAYPPDVYTSPQEAMARYGADAALALGIVPSV